MKSLHDAPHDSDQIHVSMTKSMSPSIIHWYWRTICGDLIESQGHIYKIKDTAEIENLSENVIIPVLIPKHCTYGVK